MTQNSYQFDFSAAEKTTVTVLRILSTGSCRLPFARYSCGGPHT